jgi:hypothetical protein
MRRCVPLLLVALLIAQGTRFAAAAQPASATPATAPTLQMEMANLNRSVQELLALLRESLGHQQTDLLFKRIELILQRTGPLEQERRELRAHKAADEEELKRLQAAVAAYVATEPQEGAKPENRAEAAEIVIAEANIKRLKSRISQADQRLAELDSTLLEEERNVRHWEASIDQRLGQR